MPPDSPATPRPRQVTLSGWLIIVGSVLVVLSAYERMSGLHSLETQEAISDFLSKPPGDELGLSHEGAQSLLRVLAMVAGAAAAAAAILGWQVLSQSRSARVALSILAVPLFVGGMAVFGFLAALVVVAIVMLWVQPAKDWFDGITPAARVAPAPPPPPSTPVPQVAPVASAGPSWPAPAPAPARPAPRPTPVTAAAIVTWVTCGLALAVMAITVMVLLAAPDMVFDEVRKQDPSFGQDGLSESEVRQAAFVGCGIAGVWCIAAIGFAIAAFNGYRWGWRALLISTITAGVASSLLMLGSVVMLVPLVAAAVTLGLLLRPEAKAWCRRTSGGRGSVSP